ncbi:hypothetical protein R2F61_00860 [Mollicutes bacterium LVI A0078]|nr:hypothetical protein RZE84_00860 [Mollicutes bacterium LVI A0075]WOO91131.1 hypothetical protein R2F61_00860 [Mollicutes bacterium LVI A0078]
MYNFEAIYYIDNLSGVVNFISEEYSKIDGGNQRNFKICEIYSSKAVVNKLVKDMQFDQTFSSADDRKLKQLIKQLTTKYSSHVSKQFIKSFKNADNQYKKKLLVILERNIGQPFNQTLVDYLISCKQIRNYMILPTGKLDGKRTLLQIKGNSCRQDPVEFFQVLNCKYKSDEKFKSDLNDIYKVQGYEQMLEFLTIDQTILQTHTLKECLDQTQVENYLKLAINTMEYRHTLFAEKSITSNLESKEVKFSDYNIVLELQKDDPSNKITLLKIALFTIGICISAVPLITLVENYDGNWLVATLLFFSGYAIIILFTKLLKRRKREKAISDWFSLVFYYEPILFGMGISIVAIDLVPYLFMIAMGLGSMKFLERTR